jgi:hypothetical protein
MFDGESRVRRLKDSTSSEKVTIPTCDSGDRLARESKKRWAARILLFSGSFGGYWSLL